VTTDLPGRQQQAFELYWSLGRKRTYRRVAAQLGVSVSTIKSWSRQNNWKQQIAERAVQEARQLADSAETGPDPDNVRNLKITRVALMKVAKAIAEGRVRIQMGDLDRLVKLEERLTGTHGISPKELAQYIDMIQEVKRIRPDQLKDEIRKLALDFGVIRKEESTNDTETREVEA
jgi:hypothetical protein